MLGRLSPKAACMNDNKIRKYKKEVSTMPQRKKCSKLVPKHIYVMKGYQIHVNYYVAANEMRISNVASCSRQGWKGGSFQLVQGTEFRSING